MYRVTRTLPTGEQKEREFAKIREVGQHVAFCLHDNTGMDKKQATRCGMEAERTGRVEAAGYTFVVVKF